MFSKTSRPDSHSDPRAAPTCPPGFPPGFLWGAATSAYQIEGSPLADGAGASIWHRFSHTPGTIANGETGDLACDHYRRFPDDVVVKEGDERLAGRSLWSRGRRRRS